MIVNEPKYHNAMHGIGFGLAAAFAWAIYNIGASVGRGQGFSSADLSMLRFAGGALVMLPIIALRAYQAAKICNLKILCLVAVSGPVFALLVNTGFGLAPLAHAVVISPGMSMLVAFGLTRTVEKQPFKADMLFGVGLLFAGLLVIASDQSSPPTTEPVWLGDLCFASAGSLWGVFTWLMARWRLEPLHTTALIALVSTLVYAPFYLIFAEIPHLPTRLWIAQGIYQGVLGGALAVLFYTAAVTRLGARRSGLFPALVPPLAILIAIPAAGILPNILQITGVLLTSIGLTIALSSPGILKAMFLSSRTFFSRATNNNR